MVAVSPTWLAAADDTRYEYDELGRLRRVIYPDTSQQRYTLDASGNRTQTQVTAGAGLVQLGVADATVAETAGSYNITVTRTVKTTGAISVAYTTQNGTAQAGVDYTVTSGTLNWASGDGTSRTITIPILNNLLFQPNARSFTVKLSAPTGGAVVPDTNATARISITDNDPAFFSVSAPATIGEGAGSATVTITRSGGELVQAASVSYATADGTVVPSNAVAGRDYTASAGTLTFTGSQATQTVSIPITNDAVYELSEALSFKISNPTGGVQLNSTTAGITITENDPAPVFNITTNDTSIAENASPFFIITKTGATELSFSIPLLTSGTALPGLDFTLPATADFAPQATVAAPPLTVIDDTTFEGNESFTVKLGTPPYGGVLGDDTVNYTIVENDSQPGAAPATPTGFSAYGSLGNVSLVWNRVDTATYYEAIEVSYGSIYSGPNTAASFSGQVFETYTFYVQACNNFGCGAPTEPQSVTIPCPPFQETCDGGSQVRAKPRTVAPDKKQ